MFFCPACEDAFEVGAFFTGLFHQLLHIVVQIKFNCIGGHHQVQNQPLVARIINRVAHNVLSIL